MLPGMVLVLVSGILVVVLSKMGGIKARQNPHLTMASEMGKLSRWGQTGVGMLMVLSFMAGMLLIFLAFHVQRLIR
jgi:hypothetical protein